MEKGQNEPKQLQLRLLEGNLRAIEINESELVSALAELLLAVAKEKRREEVADDSE